MFEDKGRQRADWRKWAAGHWQRGVQVLSECLTPGRVHLHPFKRAVCYIHRLSIAYTTHQCTLLACACAYCALLSMVPLLVVGVAALGFFVGGSQAALEQVVAAVRTYVPINPDFLRDTLIHVLQNRGILGLFGIIGLLYGAHQTFLALEPAMNIIWSVTETRHWLQQRLVAIGATFLSLLLLGADLGVTYLFASLQRLNEPVFHTHVASLLLGMGLTLLPMLITTVLFAMLYRLLPARTISWKPALTGAVVAALLWELTKFGFGLFLLYIHSYDRLYGSLSSLVILVVWAYYTMAILLLGAEVAADYAFMRRGAPAAEARAHSGADLAAARGTPHASESSETGPQ